MQCRPGSYMLSVKKHSSIPKIEIGKEGDNKNEKKKKKKKKKKKTEGKGKQFFPFLLTRNKRQEPQLLIKVYCQKQIATMTQ